MHQSFPPPRVLVIGDEIELTEIIPSSVMKSEGGERRVLRVQQVPIKEGYLFGVLEKPSRRESALSFSLILYAPWRIRISESLTLFHTCVGLDTAQV